MNAIPVRNTLVLTAMLNLAAGPLRAQSVQADHEGLHLTSEDGSSELTIGGRMHYDVVNIDDDVTPLENDSGLRRLRLTLSGKVAEDWRFRVERDVGGTSKGWKNLWVGYYGWKHWDLKAGQLIAPLGLEQQLSSNETHLMERSLGAALSPGFLRGVQVHYDRDGWNAALGCFGNPVDAEFDSNSGDGRGCAGRVTYAPIRADRKALHFGLSVHQRSLDDGLDLRVRARPGSGLADAALVDSGAIVDAAKTRTLGLEAAGIAGPFSVMAERLQMDVGRELGPDVSFQGWHFTVGWVMTGEARRYQKGSGTVGGVSPKRKWGALELAARVDSLDLQDAGINGGQERNITYGLNWYVGKNVRVMFNQVRAKAEPNQIGINESLSIKQVRVQVDF